jgi:Zn-dependent protease with chaperone function
MNGSGAIASFGLLAWLWLVAAAGCSLVCLALWPRLERSLARLHPRRRARRLAAIAWLPATLPTAALALCLLPGLLGLLSGRGDHCPEHLDHLHLCLVHSALSLSPVLLAGLAVFVTLSARVLARALGSAIASRRERRRLRANESRTPLAADVRVSRSPIPFALTGGGLRPRIWLSSSLVEALTSEEREVVIAHERAHAERRDPLGLALAAAVSILHPRRSRRALLAELALACEQACDERAAERVGDRLCVAETLLRVERLVGGGRRPRRAEPLRAELVGSTVPGRVRSLLAGALPDPGPARAAPLAGAIALLAVLAAKPTHHAAEHLLDLAVGLLAAL